MTVTDLLAAVAIEHKPDGSFQLRALRRMEYPEIVEAARLVIWLNSQLKPEKRHIFTVLSRN